MVYSVLLYALSFAGGTLVYWALFWSRLRKGQSVFFYRALFLLGLTVLIMLGLLLAGCPFFGFGVRDIIICLLLFLCFHLNFLTLFLVSLDRSISLFLLAEMLESRDKVFSAEEIEELFLTVYVGRNRAMEQRFHEQLVSGNIACEAGGYRLTPKGERLLKRLRLVAELFPVNRKILYPRDGE